MTDTRGRATKPTDAELTQSGHRWLVATAVVVVVVVAAAIAVLALWPLFTAPRESTPAAVRGGALAPEAQRVAGRWVRPDGGYVLELKEIRKDGTAAAAYFNPRPINVGRAEVSRKDGALAVFVELRDVNYPGSQYDLRYDPASDQLIGSYFQAVERQYYTVGFVRVR